MSPGDEAVRVLEGIIATANERRDTWIAEARQSIPGERPRLVAMARKYNEIARYHLACRRAIERLGTASIVNPARYRM